MARPTLGETASRLLAALEARDSRFSNRHAAMLQGALEVLHDESNLDSIAQSAQSMRELLEKLPVEYDGAPVYAPLEDLNSQLNEVGSSFARAKKQSKSYNQNSERWSGSIDPSLARFLDETSAILDKRKRAISRPKRKLRFFNDLDPLGALPEDVHKVDMDAWAEHEKFFIKVSHHRCYPTIREFRAVMDSCIALLADRLAPPVSATYDRLDDLIMKAESDG